MTNGNASNDPIAGDPKDAREIVASARQGYEAAARRALTADRILSSTARDDLVECGREYLQAIKSHLGAGPVFRAAAVTVEQNAQAVIDRQLKLLNEYEEADRVLRGEKTLDDVAIPIRYRVWQLLLASYQRSLHGPDRLEVLRRATADLMRHAADESVKRRAATANALADIYKADPGYVHEVVGNVDDCIEIVAKDMEALLNKIANGASPPPSGPAFSDPLNDA